MHVEDRHQGVSRECAAGAKQCPEETRGGCSQGELVSGSLCSVTVTAKLVIFIKTKLV